MKKLVIALAGLGVLGIGDEENPGWLARALASTDPDVDAAVVAYDGEDYDDATERLDAAVARRGERAELYYDRGLVLVATGDLEGARERFQNGTLSDVDQVRASSHYQLGNLGLASEDWDGAIAEFSSCLRIQPDHQNAKWNLELALVRKREQEKKDKEEQEKKDQEKQDQENQDQEKQDQEKQDQENQDQEKQDQENQDQQDGEQDKQDQQGEQDKQDQQQAEQDKQDQQGEQDKQDQQAEQEKQDQQPQPAEAIEGSDLDATLDELDRQDAFMFGRPRGAGRKVEKDW